jgi:hypothetical protein
MQSDRLQSLGSTIQLKLESAQNKAENLAFVKKDSVIK